ncbi:hypothetical protein EII34_03605 [Arachnia propionica]|uniref:Uncharacterized protein n=1 Tax=Arachnia propionica TaxID=1750 RepID=A0A3P1T9W0_9ACTN|nr:hypothetical protein [Arachnia propionica]RRD06221.1 hypothetical protein EII34_03605 [Arachnia propionica]
MDCDTHPENPLDGTFVVRDIQHTPWWPYRPVDGVIDALWLLGRDATPEGVFGDLIAEWGEALDWFIAGTSRHQLGVEPSSWTTRCPISTVTRLGQLTCEDDSPEVWHVEWWQIAPDAPALHHLLQGPLLQPRSGWWLAASADTNAGWRFVKATTGLLWWTVKAHLPYRDAEIADDSVIEALLGLLPQIGLMSVVPLNNHPVSGVVIFGTPDAIHEAAASVGGIRESQGEEVVKLWHRAGWLATL